MEKRSADALKAQLVLDKTAEETEVSVDQNDLTQHIFQRAQQEGTAPQQIIAHMQEHPHHIDEYMLEIRRGKALAVIVEAATVTDSNGDVVELARIQPDGSLGDPAGAAEVEETAARVRRRRDRVRPEIVEGRRSRPRPELVGRRAAGARARGRTPLGPLSLAGLGQILRLSGSSPKDGARFARQDVVSRHDGTGSVSQIRGGSPGPSSQREAQRDRSSGERRSGTQSH